MKVQSFTYDNAEEQVIKAAKRFKLSVSSVDYFGDSIYFNFDCADCLWLVCSFDNNKLEGFMVDVDRIDEVLDYNTDEPTGELQRVEFTAYDGNNLSKALKIIQQGAHEAKPIKSH